MMEKHLDMSKHKMVNGQLSQMNKPYSQLKNKQKENISNWMYEAYKKQLADELSNEEASENVYDKIEDAKIWIPANEVKKTYYSKNNQFKRRFAAENVPQHLFVMENILSEDGIYNMLERNKEPLARIGAEREVREP